MRKKTKERINEIAKSLESMRDELETIGEEERSKFEGLPESLQDSEKAQEMEEWADKLEAVVDYLEDAIDELNE